MAEGPSPAEDGGPSCPCALGFISRRNPTPRHGDRLGYQDKTEVNETESKWIAIGGCFLKLGGRLGLPIIFKYLVNLIINYFLMHFFHGACKQVAVPTEKHIF